jgi:hypothetical protein
MSMRNWAPNAPFVQPQNDIWINTEQLWNDTDRRKPKYSDKKSLSATLSRTDPTRTNLDANPALEVLVA